MANTSDEEAYRNVVEEVRSRSEANKPAQYIQLITMQNHSPYNDIYGDANEFRFANKTEGVPEEEAHTIAIYAKGVQRTDHKNC